MKQFFIILAIIFSQSFIFANLGNGSDGALNIGSFDEQSIGLATSVISAGGNIIEVVDASFLGSGDEVLIITMIDSNLNLDENTAGTFETKIIESKNENTLILTEPLENSYATDDDQVHQVVDVPNYTDVTVDGTLSAHAWDGATGGILFFRATGTVTVNGNIDASEKGYRGGFPALADDSSGLNGGGITGNWNFESWHDCSGGYCGPNGELLESDDLWYHVFDNGAAGGAGGGGGGLKTDGQMATYHTNNSTTHANFGMAVGSDSNYMIMGGGGGGGDDRDQEPQDEDDARGGNGGGIISIYANTITGSGSILSNGEDGHDRAYQYTWSDGAGGGGAGGTIALFSGNSNLPNTQADGGVGGHSIAAYNGGTDHSGAAGGEGRVLTFTLDECGVVDGDNSSCADCCGVVFQMVIAVHVMVYAVHVMMILRA